MVRLLEGMLNEGIDGRIAFMELGNGTDTSWIKHFKTARAVLSIWAIVVIPIVATDNGDSDEGDTIVIPHLILEMIWTSIHGLDSAHSEEVLAVGVEESRAGIMKLHKRIMRIASLGLVAVGPFIVSHHKERGSEKRIRQSLETVVKERSTGRGSA